MCSSPRPNTVILSKAKIAPTFNAEAQSRFTQVANRASERRETAKAERQAQTRQTGSQQRSTNTRQLWLQTLINVVFHNTLFSH